MPEAVPAESGRIVSAEELAERKRRKSKGTEKPKKIVQKRKPTESNPTKFDPEAQRTLGGPTESDCSDLDTSRWSGSYFDIDQEES